jgi:5'-3' exonuclease
MGIKHFFHNWFKQKFEQAIFTDTNTSTNPKIDILLIDMNGIYHTAAQKVYKYGNFKEVSLLRPRQNNPKPSQQELFDEITNQITALITKFSTSKHVVLCVDGVAPLSKQNQQRQRRFMAAKTRNPFDSNAISPGTKWMDAVSKYLDHWIRQQVNGQSNLKIIFSNDRVPGEGEAKLFSFLRKFGKKEYTYLIYGADADLIMLSLASKLPKHTKFYVFRDNFNNMTRKIEQHLINMNVVHTELMQILDWTGPIQNKETLNKFSEDAAINDFVFLCFFIGNDFLPSLPGIEVLTGGIDFMIEVYKNVGREYGHITNKNVFNPPALKKFLTEISNYEQSILEDKLNAKIYFPDPIMTPHIKEDGKRFHLDLPKFKEDYCAAHFPCATEACDSSQSDATVRACKAYLTGLNWVLSYYTKGVSDWDWRFPFHHAPFASLLAEHMDDFVFKPNLRTTPTVPFVQLLSILPPKSANLLPPQLEQILASPDSFLAKYCPTNFVVDLAGKKKEWEGIPILPMVSYEEVKTLFPKYAHSISEPDKKRNTMSKTLVYVFGEREHTFRSSYGEFVSQVGTKEIDL